VVGPRLDFFVERTPSAHVERLSLAFHWTWL